MAGALVLLALLARPALARPSTSVVQVVEPRSLAVSPMARGSDGRYFAPPRPGWVQSWTALPAEAEATSTLGAGAPLDPGPPSTWPLTAGALLDPGPPAAWPLTAGTPLDPGPPSTWPPTAGTPSADTGQPFSGPLASASPPESGRPSTWAPLSLLMQPAEPEPRFSWPLSPVPQVTRPFQQPETAYGPGHRGVDLAATPGQQVLAAGPGVVVFSGQVAGQGVVSIDHDGRLRTTYEPITPTVPAGTQVFAGQPIGTVNPGHPGCPVAACLHWGVRRGEEYLNPLALIRTESVIRLKPWDPP